MGRPKGSRNKKRKYTRRKTNGAQPPVTFGTAESAVEDEAAKAMVTQIKSMIFDADLPVARIVIVRLFADLALIAKMTEGIPPAP